MSIRGFYAALAALLLAVERGLLAAVDAVHAAAGWAHGRSRG